MTGAMSPRLVRENRLGTAKKVDHGRLPRLGFQVLPGAAATLKAGQLDISIARPFSTGQAARVASAGCRHQNRTLSALVEPVRVSYQLRKDGVKSP